MNNVIAATMDNPAGIGPEVIIKSLSKTGLAGAPVMVMSHVRTLRRIMAVNITSQAELRVTQKVCDAHFAPSTVNVVGGPLANPDTLMPGVVQTTAGNLAYRCIKRTTALTLSGEMRAAATASLNKEVLHPDGHNHPGRTESLTHLAGGKEYVTVLYTNELKVIHISAHTPLRKFLDTLNGKRTKTVVRVTNHFLKHVDTKYPRITVAGVDPHAGEHGLFGTEKIEIITPAIETMQAEDTNVIGPCPLDAVLMQCHEGLFDMVVAICHDRGRIPLELLGFYDGANITARLSFIRTSADHGTALDIAWTGKTKPESTAVSIQLTIQVPRG